MNSVVKGVLTAVVSTLVMPLTLLLVSTLIGWHNAASTVCILGAVFGLLYGLEAGLLVAYDLSAAKGWVELLLDLTWSLPNTLFGLIVGNLVYWFFGSPSRADSENTGWIVFAPSSSTQGFGNNVLQTVGTVNLGGAGQHERMHLWQARIFGPIYLLFFGLNYAVNFLLQALWTCTIGALLWKLGARTRPYFEPPSTSAVGGFFGWIYYATLFELWAYASGNP